VVRIADHGPEPSCWQPTSSTSNPHMWMTAQQPDGR
jgi:hypothetical protein